MKPQEKDMASFPEIPVSAPVPDLLHLLLSVPSGLFVNEVLLGSSEIMTQKLQITYCRQSTGDCPWQVTHASGPDHTTNRPLHKAVEIATVCYRPHILLAVIAMRACRKF